MAPSRIVWPTNYNGRFRSHASMATPRRLFSPRAASARGRRKLYAGRTPVARRRYAKRTAVPKTIRAIVRKEIRKDVEVKKLSGTNPPQSVSANVMPVNSNWCDTVQGTGDDSRIGNMITGIGFKYKLRLRNTSANVLYIRCMWFWLVTEQGTDVIDDNSQIFRSMGGGSLSFVDVRDTQNALQAPFNERAGILVYNKVIKLARNTETNGSEFRYLQPFLKFKKRIEYNENNAGVNEQSLRLCRVLLAYQPNQTLGTPAVFTYNYSDNGTFYFTDS